MNSAEKKIPKKYCRNSERHFRKTSEIKIERIAEEIFKTESPNKFLKKRQFD